MRHSPIFIKSSIQYPLTFCHSGCANITRCGLSLWMRHYTFSLTWFFMFCMDVHSNPGPPIIPFSLYHVNIRSLQFKVPLLSAENQNYDVMAVGETWLNANIPNKDVDIPHYNLYRDDRQYNHAGGAALYIHEKFISTPVAIPHSNLFEALCRDLNCQTGKLRVCCLYRPGSSPVAWFDDFHSLLDVICDCDCPIYVTADLNVDLLPDADDQHSKLRLLRLAESFSLRQIITKPTRVTPNSKSLIDVIFVRDCPTVESDVFSPFCSDHSPVLAISKKENTQPTRIKTTWLVNDGDYVAMNESILNTDWNFIEDRSIDYDIVVQNVESKMQNFMETHIPRKTFILRPRDKPWMTGRIRKAMKKRERIWKKFKRTNFECHWNSYKFHRNRVTDLVRAAKKNFFQKRFDTINNSEMGSFDWWKIVKLAFGGTSDSTIPTLQTNYDGTAKFHENDLDKANVMNDYFANIANLDDSNHLFPEQQPLCDSRLSFFEISEESVRKIIVSSTVITKIISQRRRN